MINKTDLFYQRVVELTKTFCERDSVFKANGTFFKANKQFF